MPDLFAPLTLWHGRPMATGWRVRRARGALGPTMTCASRVQPDGHGFGGRLAVHSDVFLDGLAP